MPVLLDAPSLRSHVALWLFVVGLGCREPAPKKPATGRLLPALRSQAAEQEVAQSPQPAAAPWVSEQPRSMYAGGDRTGPVVALCGLEIPVDAEILRCNLARGDDPRALARLTKVRSLSLYRAPDSLDGGVLVESIASLPELISLHLGPDVHVVSLRGLVGASSLRSLTLDHPPAQAIPSLAELMQLEELQVDAHASTDYSPLATLTNLHKLVLMGPGFENLEELVGLDGLVELNLDVTRVRELEPLQRMQLRGSLSLSRTPVVDLGPLAQVELSALNLDHTEITDLSPLRGHASLRWLSLYRTKVTDVSPLANVKSLRWLSLADTAVTNVSSLSRLELEYLDLSGTPTRDLGQLSRFRRLQRLDLCDLELDELAVLEQLEGLEQLWLLRSRVDPDALAQLRAARPELEIHI